MNVLSAPKRGTYQQGFTLLELIVALALGLIISAAALQLFTGGIITAKLQEASAELQESGVFGVDYVAKDIRLANYGNVNNLGINTYTPNTGILFTASPNATDQVNLPGLAVDSKLLTRSDGESTTNIKSDQLTIMFQAPHNMMNCEGVGVAKGSNVIQRYFLKKDSDGNLALACHATNKDNIVGAKETEGTVIIPRVDLVKFYLGIKFRGDKLRYYRIQDFMESGSHSGNNSRVISIRMMMLVRTKDPIKYKHINPNESFNFYEYGGPAWVNDKSPYLRRLYTTTIALRNGLGEKIYEN